MKKKIIFICLTIFTLIILTGCSNINKEQRKKYEQTAKSMAISHIESKYHIKAKVISTRAYISGSFPATPELTGGVYVTMKHKKKKFYVLADVRTNKVGDTYQNDQIKKDCIAFLEKIYGKKITYFKSELDAKDYFSSIYYEKYYTKKEMISFFHDFTAGFINAKSVSAKDLEPLQKILNRKNDERLQEHEGYYSPRKKYINFKIYNYKSKQAYKKVLNTKTNQYADVIQYIYLKELYENNEEDVSKYDVDIKEADITPVIKDKNKIYSINNYKKDSLSQQEVEKIFPPDDYYPYKVLDIITFNPQKEETIIYIKKNIKRKLKTLKGKLYCKQSGNTYSSNIETVGDYFFLHKEYYDSYSKRDVTDCDKLYFVLIREK